MSAQNIILYGLGNPIVDLIAHVALDDVKALGAVPGSMNLVDGPRQTAVLESTNAYYRAPGGSCSNTVRAVAFLNRQTEKEGRILYTGCVGGDEDGRLFSTLLERAGVEPILATKSAHTGTSAILVSQDHERTMFTNLGASRELAYDDIDAEAVTSCGIFHTTGYMWDTENQEAATMRAARQCREAGGVVSFDVADPFVADRYRDKLQRWIPGNVDLLFANREELASLLERDDEPETLIRAAADLADTVALKVGKDGCLVLNRGEVVTIPGVVVEPKDTTGAGDAFAGGFLFGLISGETPVECGMIANRLAASVVSVEACDYEAVEKLGFRL